MNVLISRRIAPPALDRSQLRFWFSLSLGFSLLCSLLVLPRAFDAPYTVEDDTRLYLFWMFRFIDPQLFPNDLLASYYQSITPPGYAELYHFLSVIGIDPVLASKLLPTVLGLVSTGYAFAVCLQILPVPIAGFLATLVLNQALWIHDDIVAAAPRGFFYPLFLAFLYYLLRRSWLPCLVTIALQALFYPIVTLISCGILILRLLDWHGGRPHLSKDRQSYIFTGLGLGVAIAALLPYAIASNTFGPTITAAQAITMPEYWAGGRIRYYDVHPLSLWLDGRDSGIFSMLSPPQLFVGWLLPFLLPFRDRFPLVQRIKPEVRILLQTVIVSVILFLAAHLLAFRLYFPSRYTFHTFQMIFSLATGIVLAVLLHAAFYWAEVWQSQNQKRRGQVALRVAAVILGMALLLYPLSLSSFPKSLYVQGQEPGLYEFLKQQPPGSIVASLSREVDSLPTFSQRPILVGRRYGLPFHVGFYDPFRQRAIALIDAQYSPDLNQVKRFIKAYGVKFWLLDLNTFSPEYIETDGWIKQYQPAANQAVAQLRQEQVPALVKLLPKCIVYQSVRLVLLNAQCVADFTTEKKG
jgi:hypothetical protein